MAGPSVFLVQGGRKRAQASHRSPSDVRVCKRSMLPGSHREPRHFSPSPMCCSVDNSEAWRQRPAVFVNPSIFLSLMLTGFPLHKRVLLTRSLCSKAMGSWGLEPPLAKAAGGCLGLQTFLRSKSGEKYQTLFEVAAPAFFGVSGLLPHPQPQALSDPAFYILML